MSLGVCCTREDRDGVEVRWGEPTGQEGRRKGWGDMTAPWMGINANACMGDTLGSSGTGPAQQPLVTAIHIDILTCASIEPSLLLQVNG